eukprot:5789046-Alexandrium_andersonii.AAC.1
MSASLVGSEMCIRDSLSHSLPTLPWWTPGWRGSAGASGQSPLHPSSAAWAERGPRGWVHSQGT